MTIQLTPIIFKNKLDLTATDNYTQAINFMYNNQQFIFFIKKINDDFICTDYEYTHFKIKVNQVLRHKLFNYVFYNKQNNVALNESTLLTHYQLNIISKVY